MKFKYQQRCACGWPITPSIPIRPKHLGQLPTTKHLLHCPSAATDQTLRGVCEYFGLSYDEVMVPTDTTMPIEMPGAGRVNFAKCLATLPMTRGAEVGVAGGRFSRILCENNPALQLHLIDVWDADGEVQSNKRDWSYDYCMRRMTPFVSRVTVHKKFSVVASTDIEDQSLDFVYLDANHNLPDIIADLAAWIPKVRPGGIVAGHDYHPYGKHKEVAGVYTPIQVKPAIHAWVSAYKVRPWFVLGQVGPEPTEPSDQSLSFFWVV